MATTPHPPRTRLQNHQDAVRRADDNLAAVKADLQTRSAAFGQDVLQAGPDNSPSLETGEIKASELLDAADTPAAIKDKCKAFLGDALRLREAVAKAAGCEMVRELPPTPEKNGPVTSHTPGSASTVARRVSFFGKEMIMENPAESTPDTPALLKQLRESGVSPMLTLLSDDQLKDPEVAAAAVRSLTPAALATVGLRAMDGERGTQKRRRATDPAPRGMEGDISP